MKNIIFVAPPGAGKGTFGEILEERYGYTSLSMGELLREEKNSGSELGKEISAIIDQGNLVSSELIKKFMIKVFNTIDLSKPYIFDGFLRRIQSAKDYEKIIKEKNMDIGLVIYINVDKETLEKRCLGRYGCPKCNKIYNINSDKYKPKQEGICDICNVSLEQRQDDTKEGFEKRYNNYLDETVPVLEYFQENYKVLEIDGTANIEDSIKIIAEAIGVNNDNY